MGFSHTIMNKEIIKLGQFVDLTNQLFGEITVLEKDVETSKQKGRIYWKCKCSCGREKSIRADHLKKIQTCGECKKDLSNQRFGRLIALQKGKKDSAQHQFWVCKCDCGNICEINSDNLRRGLTQSCGCLHSERTHQIVFKDITGQKFGKLTAIDYKVKNNKTIWICKCDCGNICEIAGSNLKNGHTSSCGCINYSIGEKNIIKILKDNNICFKKEYVFNDFPQRRYDFYLPEYNKLIEFDGRQHYVFQNNWLQSREEFEQGLKRDIEKNEYAQKHNIPLIRIPYQERDNITLEMIMGDQYLITKEKKND